MGDAGSMQMRSFVLLSLAAAAAAAPQVVQPLFTRGHAAYTYGPLHCVASPCSVVPSCNSAHWKKSIEAFNTDTSVSDAAITTVYSYGGDVEFWPDKANKQACWARREPSREVEISLENPCKAPMDGSDGWRGEKIYRKNRQIEVETMSANVASMNATRTGMKTTQ